MRIPCIVGLNYRVRTMAFAWSFLVIGLILWERAHALGGNVRQLETLVHEATGAA